MSDDDDLKPPPLLNIYGEKAPKENEPIAVDPSPVNEPKLTAGAAPMAGPDGRSALPPLPLGSPIPHAAERGGLGTPLPNAALPELPNVAQSNSPLPGVRVPTTPLPKAGAPNAPTGASDPSLVPPLPIPAQSVEVPQPPNPATDVTGQPIAAGQPVQQPHGIPDGPARLEPIEPQPKSQFSVLNRLTSQSAPQPPAAVPRRAADFHEPVKPKPSHGSLFGLSGSKDSNTPVTPPILASAEPGGLPPLGRPQAAAPPRSPSASEDLKQRVERIKQGAGSGFGSKRQVPAEGRSVRPMAGAEKPVPGISRRPTAPRLSPWVLVAIAAGGLVLLAMAAFFVLGETPDTTPLVAPTASAPPTAAEVKPQSGATPALTLPEERLAELARAVRGRGPESPALAAVIDEELALANQVLKDDRCENDSDSRCAAWQEIREVFAGQNVELERRERPKTRPRWMAGLKLPDFPVAYETLVKKHFEFYTVNPEGRAVLERMMFRCGAYLSRIRSTLKRVGLPVALQAVVFAESGCSPTIESEAGAAGLWQFMPGTGRAYGLHVDKETVDERRNPFKATDSAVRLLSDLYRKLGDWELALAAYNAGASGMLLRVQRAGGNVGFWDLVDAEMLPEETKNYVPRIQAIALILNNTRRLRFAGAQTASPELTADLHAPVGTPLAQVAQAASTSYREIKRLNPDILADAVPEILGSAFAIQVPADIAEPARHRLSELRAQGSRVHLCVGPTFDWGRKRFTREMARRCERRLQIKVGSDGN